MNDEIKEILDNVKKCCDIMKDNNFVVYQKQDILKLLDYITNLQKQIEEYQKALDETMSKKIDLQEENQRLKENNQNMQVEMARSWEIMDKAIEYIADNILKGENND